MPVIDYRLLYESMLTQKQELDVQHELLGDEVKRLKSVIAKLKENATAQALALKAAKAMQQAETERADKMELRLEAVRALFFGAVPSNDELDIAISHARNNSM